MREQRGSFAYLCEVGLPGDMTPAISSEQRSAALEPFTTLSELAAAGRPPKSDRVAIARFVNDRLSRDIRVL